MVVDVDRLKLNSNACFMCLVSKNPCFFFLNMWLQRHFIHGSRYLSCMLYVVAPCTMHHAPWTADRSGLHIIRTDKRKRTQHDMTRTIFIYYICWWNIRSLHTMLYVVHYGTISIHSYSFIHSSNHQSSSCKKLTHHYVLHVHVLLNVSALFCFVLLRCDALLRCVALLCRLQ